MSTWVFIRNVHNFLVLFFLLAQNILGSLYAFSIPALEPAISSGSPGLFWWIRFLETKIWMLNVVLTLIALWISSLLYIVGERTWEIEVYICYI